MTSNAIKEIKKTEENAAQMIVNAQTESKYRVEQAVLEIEKSKTDAEKKFKEIYDARITSANEQAKAILSSKREQAHSEAKRIEDGAQEKMNSAVEIILEEIKSVWQ